jgi:hypothetical protein
VWREGEGRQCRGHPSCPGCHVCLCTRGAATHRVRVLSDRRARGAASSAGGSFQAGCCSGAHHPRRPHHALSFIVSHHTHHMLARSSFAGGGGVSDQSAALPSRCPPSGGPRRLGGGPSDGRAAAPTHPAGRPACSRCKNPETGACPGCSLARDRGRRWRSHPRDGARAEGATGCPCVCWVHASLLYAAAEARSRPPTGGTCSVRGPAIQ